MRILVWSDLFFPLIGGAEVRLLYLLEGLQQLGHESIVITNRFPSAPLACEEWKGIPIHRLEIRQALAARDMRQLKSVQGKAMEIKQAFNPDVEHVICTGPCMMIQQVCNRAMPRPVVSTLHSDFGELFRNHANAALVSMFRQSAFVVALSHQMLKECRARFPELADRFELVTSGVPMPKTEPTPLPFAPPVILCLGRLIDKKGFDLALRALAILAPDYPALRMVVAGDGPDRVKLEDLAIQLGVGKLVTFEGWVESVKVPDLINRATLTIVPSRNEEPSSVVLRETAQMGRPVVASRVGGTSELVEDGVTGLLFEREDVAAIASAVRRLLENPDEARALGATARRLAVERFDFQRYLNHILLLYRRACAPRASASPISSHAGQL